MKTHSRRNLLVFSQQHPHLLKN